MKKFLKAWTTSPKYYYYDNSGEFDFQDDIPDGYVEITLEQFKKYVLKENNSIEKIEFFIFPY